MMEAAVVQGFGNEVIVFVVGLLIIFVPLFMKAGRYQNLRDRNDQSGVNAPDADSKDPNAGELRSSKGPGGDVEEDQEEEDDTQIHIRLKLLDDTEKKAECPLSMKIGAFKEKFFADELKDGKNIRLIYRGKVLNDHKRSLKRSGVFEDGCVVHAQVSNPPTPAAETETIREVPRNRIDVHLSYLFYPIIGVLLVLFWYFHFHFRESMTGSTTTALVGISGLFCMFAFTPAPPLYYEPNPWTGQ